VVEATRNKTNEYLAALHGRAVDDTPACGAVRNTIALALCQHPTKQELFSHHYAEQEANTSATLDYGQELVGGAGAGAAVAVGRDEHTGQHETILGERLQHKSAMQRSGIRPSTVNPQERRGGEAGGEAGDGLPRSITDSQLHPASAASGQAGGGEDGCSPGRASEAFPAAPEPRTARVGHPTRAPRGQSRQTRACGVGVGVGMSGRGGGGWLGRWPV